MIPPTARQSAVPHADTYMMQLERAPKLGHVCRSAVQLEKTHSLASQVHVVSAQRFADQSIMLSAQRVFFFSVVVDIPRICRLQVEQVCLIAGLGTILSSPVQTLITSSFIVVLNFSLSLSLYKRLSAHNLDFTLLATRLVSIGPAVQT